MNERSIFFEALDIADPAARAKYVEQACGGDALLRQQVARLLAAHERQSEFLDSPVMAQIARGPMGGNGQGDTESSANLGDVDLDALTFLTPSKKAGSLGVLGHYEILEVIGKGGMGIVLRAFDDKLHRVVAIKVLAPHLASSGTARQRFVREARATAAVSHDNVIAIHAVEEAGPVPYLVMHFVNGRTLQDKLNRTGPPPLKEILRIGLQIAEGLAAAHKQGLIHRDVKPANVLLENGIERVRITDFGLARAVDDASLTQSGVISGTPQYVSPEQAEGTPVDQRSDLFSLGSVLYVLCTGHPPFRAQTAIAVLMRVSQDSPRPIHELNPDIPRWLEAIVARLHAKDPAKRFRSAAEVAELLGQHLADVQQRNSASLVAQQRAARGTAPRRTWVAVVVAAVLVAVTGIALVAFAVIGFLMPLPHPSAPAVATPPEPGMPRTPEERANLPSPLDGRKHADLPAGVLAVAGGGDPAKAPPELVAMLGEPRFQPLEGTVHVLECSPDGRLLAAASGRKVLIFEIKTGRLWRSLPLQTGDAYRVSFSPDGARLLAAMGGPDGSGAAELWEIETRKLIRIFTGHAGRVLNVAFGPKAETVIAGGVDRTVRIWDVASGRELRRLPHGDHVHGLAVSADGKYLFTGCNDRSVRLWDLASGELKGQQAGHSSPVASIRFSPDGRRMLTGAGGEAIVWDAATFTALQTLPEAGEWARFTPDGATVLCAKQWFKDDEHHVVTRWNVNTGQKQGEASLPSVGSWAALALSPDGKTLFDSRTVPPLMIRACDPETGKELTPGLGPVNAIAISPDGRLLASGGDDHLVRLWDLATGKQRNVLDRHTHEVFSLAFSGDGTLLASGSRDGTIALWDVATGKAVRTLAGHCRSDSTIAFSPDGKTVAAGGVAGDVKLWDATTGKPRDPIRRHAGLVRAVAFSPDGNRLAFAGDDSKVHVGDVATGRLLQTFTMGVPRRSVCFSGDGQALAATCEGPRPVHLWDLRSGKEVDLSGCPAQVSGLDLQPTGGLMATGSSDGTVCFLDRISGRKRLVNLGAGASIRAVAFTPEGRYLAAANENGGIAILRVPALPAPNAPGSPPKLPDPAELARRPSPADALDRAGIPAELLPENAPGDLVAVLGDRRLQHQGPVVTLRFIDNDKTLVSLGRDKTVRFWSAADGRQQRLVPIDTPVFTGFAISPDASMLALGYDGTGAAKLWDLTTNKELRQLDKAADRGVLCPGMAFSPDGKKLVTGGRWHWSKVWDPATGTELRKLNGHGCNVYAFAFNPDGTTVASGDEAGQLILWDATTGQKRATVRAHSPRAVLVVNFAADGRTLATGSTDKTVKLWDATGKELATFVHGGELRSVALTADGQVLASGSADKTIKLWDVATGKERATLLGHSAPITGLAFTADAKTLASASDDGTIKLWDVAAGQERTVDQGHVGTVLSVAISPNGKTVASAGADATIKLWDLASAKLARTLKGPTGPVQAVGFSPNGKWLATQGADGMLRLWDAATGRHVLTTADHRADAWGVAFSADSRLVATTSVHGPILLWDVDEGKIVRRLSECREGVLRVAFSPDGKHLAGVGRDGARVWEVSSGWQTSEFRGPAKGYATVAFSPDGKLLALGTMERAIELHDAATGSDRGTFPANAESGLAFRGDGQLLASTGPDGAVKLWHVRPRPGPRKPVTLFAEQKIGSVALTPEGRYLATANADGTIYVLRLATRGEVFQVPEP